MTVRTRFFTPAIALALLLLETMSPSAAAEFEVASVKPKPPSINLEVGMVAPPGFDGRLFLQDRLQESMQDSYPAGWIPSTNMRVTLRRWTLASLIAAAYSVRREQIIGPSWLTEERFEIEAKIPESAPPSSLNEMLQALLVERFGLKVHTEERTLSGYALTVASSGLKLPAASTESSAQAAPSTGIEGLRKIFEQGLKGEGMTTVYQITEASGADIARRISQFLHKPVVDATALQGKYTFRLEIRRVPDNTPEYAASQALSALGMKLDSRKVPAQVIIVDSASQTPAAN